MARASPLLRAAQQFVRDLVRYLCIYVIVTDGLYPLVKHVEDWIRAVLS